MQDNYVKIWQQRVLVAVVARSVCGKLIVQRALVAVVAKVANLIRDNFSNRYMSVAEVARVALS